MVQLQISDMLYSIYGRMRHSEQLSHGEIQFLNHLRSENSSLNAEHQAMLRRIHYRLSKHQHRRDKRQYQQEQARFLASCYAKSN